MGRIKSALILSLLAASACGDPPEAPPPDRPPVFPQIERFEAESPTVVGGSTVRLHYRVKNATSIRIQPGLIQSSTELEGMVETSPINETTTFTLTAVSEVGETSRSVVVTLVEGEVMIESFSASEPVIAPGASTTLRWVTRAATSVKLTQVGGPVLIERAEATGELTVMPSSNTSYLITAEGFNGPKTAQLLVLVGLEPQVMRFVADPPQVTVGGGGSTLRWDAVNATSVTIRDGRGVVVASNAPLSGSQVVNPAVTTSYMLVASSAVGSAAAMASVTVLPAGSARILEFAADPSTIPAPGDVTVRWQTADADTVDLLADGVAVASFPRTASGTMTLRMEVTTLLTLRAENAQGATSADATVTVGTPDTTGPIVMHSAIANGQAAGGSVEILATITDAEGPVGTATLFYRTQGDAAFQSMTLLAQGNDRFSATIPAVAIVAPGVEYYLLATDSAPIPNSTTSPVGAPAIVHTFTVQIPDTAGPNIMHVPPVTDLQEGQAFIVTAVITDPSGVQGASLNYKLQTASLYTRIPMVAAGDQYSATIPLAEVLAPGVDYYIEAEDTRTPVNQSFSPGTAPVMVHSVRVVALDLTPPQVTHTPIANGQAGSVAVTITADVVDPSGVGAVDLFYKAQSAPNYTSVAMTGTGATRAATIPGASVLAPGVDYYFQVADQAAPANVGRVPLNAPGTPYSFTVTVLDMAAPTIQHTPISDGQTAGVAKVVVADVADGSGVASATLRYRTIGGGVFASLPMAGGPSYSASIPGAQVVNPGIEYYFEAVDASPNANSARLPANAPASWYTFRTGIAEVEPNNGTGTATPFLGVASAPQIALGAIGVTTDRDFYIVDVPTGPRLNLRAEVTIGGAGLCNGTADPRLRLYASNGTTELVNDDDDGVAACPLIDAATDLGARALAPGRYYLVIEEDGLNATIPGYEIRATLSPVACGNGIFEGAAGEQCEDSNVTPGDGCSATCTLETEGAFTGAGGALVGAINPGGDVDVFSVTVGAGQFLYAFISDGAIGCPGDMILELYGPDGVTLLGSDDDDGIAGGCPDISPVRDIWARNLAAGTYFLRAKAFNPTAVFPSYTLTVNITSGVCGNGTVEGTEQCDDADATSNDGCSATCQWETAGMITGTGGAVMGGLTPVGNIDWYQVTVPNGYALRAETFAPTDGVCTSADTVVRLWAANRTTQIGSDDDGGAGQCSLLNPVTDVEVRGLTGGTYYLSVEEYQNNATVPMYVMNVLIDAPRCGDSYLSGAETCDDGNGVGGDGCSAACIYEGPAELEPNDSRATANVLIPTGMLSGSVLGNLSDTVDSDYYSVVVPSGHHLIAEVTGPNGTCPYDLDLELFNSAGTSRVFDNQDGIDNCPRISPGLDTNAQALGAGTYYLEVSVLTNPTQALYKLDVRVVPNGCGDLYQDFATEPCDDGNTTSGDGCSATCTLELVETEPNDAFGTATPIGAGLEMVDGAIVAGESDWYSVVVPANGSMHVATHRGAIDQCAGVLESVVEVYSADGTTLVGSDVQDGPGYCSVLYRPELSNLAAGTYYIRVRGFAAADFFDYVLSVDLTP